MRQACIRPSSGRDYLGVTKVLRLDLCLQQPVARVVVAEYAITTISKRPQGALLCHTKRVSITAIYCEHP